MVFGYRGERGARLLDAEGDGREQQTPCWHVNSHKTVTLPNILNNNEVMITRAPTSLKMVTDMQPHNRAGKWRTGHRDK